MKEPKGTVSTTEEYDGEFDLSEIEQIVFKAFNEGIGELSEEEKNKIIGTKREDLQKLGYKTATLILFDEIKRTLKGEANVEKSETEPEL